MAGQYPDDERTGKKIEATEREMSTALLLLRATQVGVSISDMDLLTIGMIQDMYVEAMNDQAPYARLATQEDFDKF